MTSENPPEPKQPGTPLWLRAVLVVSLALNLLVVGVIAGSVTNRLRDGGPHERVRMARDLAPAPFVLAVDPEDRRALLGTLRKSAGPLRQDRAAMRAEFRDMLTALRAEDFDAAAVGAMLETMRDRGAARQAAGEDVFLAYLADLSPEARRAYADRLERTVRRFDRR